MSSHQPNQRPAPLLGPMHTRKEAKDTFAAIVADMRGIHSEMELEGFLMDWGLHIKQIEEELEFLWSGDGFDFLGLEKEIAAARARCALSF